MHSSRVHQVAQPRSDPLMEDDPIDSDGESKMDIYDTVEETNNASLDTLQKKTRERYEKEYSLFKEWMQQERTETKISENVVVDYFAKKAETLKSPSLWTKFSMLCSMMMFKENVNIKFPKVIAFLKHNGADYKSQGAKNFSRDEVVKFVHEAPDELYLMMKVAIIIGTAGACKCKELVRVSLSDIQDKGSVLIIQSYDSKKRIQRTFTITDESIKDVNAIEIYRKYLALRPSKTPHLRLFVAYIKGKCTIQPVGINTMAKVPYNIAKYLRLPNPETYTGHSFKQTALSQSDFTPGQIFCLKRYGRRRAKTIAEVRLDDSIQNKWEVANEIIGEEMSPIETTGDYRDNFVNVESEHIESQSECSSTISVNEDVKGNIININSEAVKNGENLQLPQGITFNNISNCTININITTTSATTSNP